MTGHDYDMPSHVVLTVHTLLYTIHRLVCACTDMTGHLFVLIMLHVYDNVRQR